MMNTAHQALTATGIDSFINNKVQLQLQYRELILIDLIIEKINEGAISNVKKKSVIAFLCKELNKTKIACMLGIWYLQATLISILKMNTELLHKTGLHRCYEKGNRKVSVYNSVIKNWNRRYHVGVFQGSFTSHTHTHTSPPTGKSIAKIWTEQADVKICVVQFYTSITMGCIANDGKDL